MPSHAPGRIGETGVLSGFILVVGRGRVRLAKKQAPGWGSDRGRLISISPRDYSAGNTIA